MKGMFGTEVGIFSFMYVHIRTWTCTPNIKSLLRARTRRANRDVVFAVSPEVVLDGFPGGGVDVAAGDEVDVVAGEVLDEEGAVVGVHHLEDRGHLEGGVQHALAGLRGAQS